MDMIRHIFLIISLVTVAFPANTLPGVEKKTVTLVVDGVLHASPDLSRENVERYGLVYPLGKGIYAVEHRGGGIYYHKHPHYKPVPTVFVWSFTGDTFPGDFAVNLKTGTILMGTLNCPGERFRVKVEAEAGKKVYFFILDRDHQDNSGQIKLTIKRLQ